MAIDPKIVKKQKAFRPMKGEQWERGDPITFPKWGSPKIDGIRCIIVNGDPMTYRLDKLIRNDVIRTALQGLPFFDGELTIGDAYGDGVLRRSSSGVMSASKPELENLWTYWVFDYAHPEKWQLPYRYRLELLKQHVAQVLDERPDLVGRICVIEQQELKNQTELEKFEEAYTLLGYEGVMVRCPDAYYKWGRSTVKEGLLMKMKRFVCTESRILEVIEEMENLNELETNGLGLAKRSQVSENKVGKGIVGAYLCETWRAPDGIHYGLEYEFVPGCERVEFSCSAAGGTTKEQRKEDWDNRTKFPGAALKHKYMPTPGADKPRHPSAICVRLD